MTRKRTLVTGATGFVGASLARRLLRDGHEVHLLVRPGHAGWRIDGIRDRVTLHAMPLAEREGVAAVVRAVRPEWVFHLAAYGAYPAQQDFAVMMQTNVMGTANLAGACAASGVEAFVFAGSSSEYGYLDHAAEESERLEPNSRYAITKAAASHYCLWAARAKQLPAVVMRLYSIYGPWEEPTRLIPTLLVRGLRGELPPLVEPGVARDFVYVEDAVDALVRAVTLTPGTILNLSSGRQATVAEVVGLVRKLLSVAAEPQWGSMPNRGWDTTCWTGSADAAARALGWSATTSLEEGLRKTIGWLRDRPVILERYGRIVCGG